MFAAISGGMGEPLNAMQLLWINLISDIFPGLALALEPPEPDVLNHPPRDPDEPIITKGDLKRIGFESAVLSAGTLGAYGYGIARYGIGPQAGSLAFMTLSVAQLLHVISCRSEEHGIFDRSSQERQPLTNPILLRARRLPGLSSSPLLSGLRASRPHPTRQCCRWPGGCCSCSSMKARSRPNSSKDGEGRMLLMQYHTYYGGTGMKRLHVDV
jgi:Ca2+-transporting ATPase